MNQELILSLQSCIDSCEKIKKLLQEQQDSVVEAIDGDLRKDYIHAIDLANEVVSKMKEKLCFLQSEQKLEL